VTQIVYGVLADELGLSSDRFLEQGSLGPELRLRAWATPAAEVRTRQAAHIPVDRDHDGIAVGELVHLERRFGKLWAVAEVSDSVNPITYVRVGDKTIGLESDLYWSGSRLSTPDFEDVIFDSVALTPSTCRVAARPVKFLEGALDYRGCTRRWEQLDKLERELLELAAQTVYNRRGQRGAPLYVHDQERERSLEGLSEREKHFLLVEQADALAEGGNYDEAWKNRPLRYRPGRILSVS
jgi:hypothetical protein